jgi:endonuclease/exonuclease/phosphatase family metal-dependent hydrolase
VSPTVRVTTWNIQHAKRGDTGVVDPDALAADAAALGADVLSLQEVDRRTARVGGVDLLDVVAEATGLVPVDGAVVDLQGGTYGNALLVRDDLIDARSYRVGPRPLPRPWWPPWDRPEPRGVVIAYLAAVDVLVVGCHLGLRPKERRRQFHELLRPHAAGAIPVVVAGDLNTRPPELGPYVARYGFTAVDVPAAFPAHEPRIVIDHVLVRGIAMARPCPPADRPVVSDHRPVSVEVEPAAR